MELSNHAIPTNDDVRRLIESSSRSTDRRALAAVILVLWQGFSVSRLDKLCWANWDAEGRTLIIPSRSGRHLVIPLTVLVNRILASIPRTGKTLIFAPPTPLSPMLSVLLTQILARADLSSFTPADFVRWSELQLPTTRLSTATAQ
jgi:hypothetical protein